MYYRRSHAAYPVLGVDIHDVGYADILAVIDDYIASKKQGIIATVNNEIVLWAIRTPALFRVLKNTVLNVPDSIGMLIGTRFFGFRLKNGRVIGVELVNKIAEHSRNRNYRIFLLGGSSDEKIGQRAADALKKRYNATIVGTDPGPALSVDGTMDTSYDFDKLKNLIESSRANILLAAFGGGPKQELWLSDHIKDFPGIAIGIGVGGTFDYLSGKVLSVPVFIRKIGFEWLWRLCTQKKRIKRVFNAIFIFTTHLVWWKIRSVLFFRKGIIGVIVNDDKKILLCKQARPPFWWQLVQGGTEEGEDVSSTIQREIYEEIGVRDQCIIKQMAHEEFAYSFGIYGRARYGYRGQKKQAVLLQCPNTVKIRLDERIFSNYIWASYQQAIDKIGGKRGNEEKSIRLFKDYFNL